MTMIGIQMHPLSKFIQDEIDKRGISDAAFARLCNIDPSTISNWINDPPENPSYEKLKQLAVGTSTDLCTIIALISPELTKVSARRELASRELADLTIGEIEQVNNFLLALKFNRRDKQ